MDQTLIKRMFEAVIFAADEPVTVEKLKQTLPEEYELANKEIKVLLTEMQDAYHENSFRLIETASGYRFQIREQYAEMLGKLMEEKPPKYSRAFLETLVIIAYRQPITRAEIEEIRGVAVNSVIIKTLLEREWIRVIGHRDVPGRPSILGTSKQFLDYFNLKSLEDLPPLEEIKDLDKMAAELEQQLPLDFNEHETKQTENHEAQASNTELASSEIESNRLEDSAAEICESEVNQSEERAAEIVTTEVSEVESSKAESGEIAMDDNTEIAHQEILDSEAETASFTQDQPEPEREAITDPEPA